MTKGFASLAILFAGTMVLASGAFAASAFAQPDPRIDEVQKRVHVQDRRIDHALAKDKITADQAKDLHARDQAIAAKLAADRSLHDGHITGAEQRSLNHQENSVGHQISHEAHRK